jgi:serine/threonine protein kinase/WD40 repeat protein
MQTPSRNEESIFAEALTRQLPERATFLDAACGDDAALRQRVEALLRSHEEAGSFLDPTLSGTVETRKSDGPGTTVGPYKLLQQLGSGGMGVVYMAEQQFPVRRRVALKIIKPGMDSSHVLARFEAERQALAVMDHPNIAHIFDANTTETGRPYFVMELVHGVPITRYCDENHLTPRQRLELFIPICQAIQHAHHKGIIHRDIKPSNVMITLHDGQPVPKVIDFGIAKAIDQRLTERTLFTQYGTMVGTLEYMSPEQAEMSGLGVDTRSDVYSLGVLLYELLTGSPPLEQKRLLEAAYDEMLRIIRDEEPPRPSKRISTAGERLATISADRGTNPVALARLLRGELDWIVMRCLEKDRSRRYSSADALAQDVQRYLADEPVEACPPSVGYRVRKFARRHRTLLLTVGMIAALLIVGTVVSAWLAFRALRAEEKADKDRIAAQNSAGIAKQEAEDARKARKALGRTLYASRSNLIQVAWEANNISRVVELLDEQRPAPGEDDERGFEWYYWDRLCHAELRGLQLGYRLPPRPTSYDGHVVFSDDGTRCAAVGPQPSGTAQPDPIGVWNLADGREVFSLPYPVPGPVKLGLSGDGQRLAVLSTLSNPDKTNVWGNLAVYDIASRKELLSTTTPGDLRHAPTFLEPTVKLTRAGQRVALILPGADEITPNPTFLIWDVAAGAKPTVLPGIPMWAALSPDGTRVAHLGQTRGDAGQGTRTQLEIKDIATGKVLATSPWPEQAAQVPPRPVDTALMDYSADGSRLTANGISIFVIWDAQGKLLSTFRPSGGQSVHAVSPDGSRVATWSGLRNSIGQVWDTATGEAILTIKGPLGSVIASGFSSDSKRLYSAERLGNVKEWVVRRGENPNPGRPGITSIWSRDGARELVFRRGHPTETVILVRDATGKEIRSFTEHKGAVLGVVCNPDGRWVVSMDRTRQLKVWNTETGKVHVTLTSPALGWPGPPPVPVFSGDSRRVILNLGQAGVKVLDLASDSEVFSHPAWGTVVSGSPDGRRLAIRTRVSAEDTTPDWTLWDVDTGKLVCTLPRSTHRALFSPDGKRLACCQTDSAGRGAAGEITLRDADTGAEVLTLKQNLVASSVAFSPDSKWLVTAAGPTGDSAGDILIWDLASGQVHQRLKGHDQTVTSVAYTPDGRRLASLAHGRSGTEVKVWDTVTGSELLALKATRRAGVLYSDIHFTPDGHRLFLESNLTAAERYQVWDGTPR